ncbi:MAG: Shedu immune nuclease family protein [Desulfobaccales bacterium]
MTCPKCQHIIDRQDIPHVIKKCEGCGRIMYVPKYGPFCSQLGSVFKIIKGDTRVIPKGWFFLSPNPLKGSGKFTLTGLQLFAKMVFLDDLPTDKFQFMEELYRIEKGCIASLNKSELLQGLDITNPDHTLKIIDLFKDIKDTAEWWILQIWLFLNLLNEALELNDIQQAILSMACVERCRSMLIFKEHLEEIVWIGHSAKRIIDVLRIWVKHKIDNDEEFWQRTFIENSYVISQVFAVPIVFIKDKAYVGGMNIDRKEAKFVDYLFSMESSREAILVEIKTPVAKLLGRKYRGVFRPSSELTGAIVQVLDYRNELINNLKSVVEGTTHNISLFNPRCVVIIGNGEDELKDEIRRKSFELFRSTLRDVEIITYDELFRKVEILANLFNLVKPKAKE